MNPQFSIIIPHKEIPNLLMRCLKSVFQVTKDPKRLVKELALYQDQPIIAGETLMIFDEIQACEEALNSLKYFCEEYVLNDNVQDVGLYNINTKGDTLNDIQIRDVFLAYKLVVTE